MTRPPTVAFRADASTEIGTGHVMRCLTLADALAERGIACHFLSRALPGHLCDRISAHGHHLHRLAAPGDGTVTDPDGPAHAGWLGLHWRDDAAECRPILAALGPDWLVMDHYALDARWQGAVLPDGCRLMVIDDLADRPHVADVLLDQNLGREAADYGPLVPEGCDLLIGPRFALLRPEFAAQRAYSLARRKEGRLHRLCIAMGGVDRENATGAVLDALARIGLPEGVEVTVILGGTAPHLGPVRAMAGELPFACEVLVDRSDMADILAETDLAIGAAGSSTWERCCLGVPTLVLVLADNQAAIAEAIDKAKAGILLGRMGSDGWAGQLRGALAATGPGALAQMSRHAATCCDGSGLATVCGMIRSTAITVRKAARHDAETVWAWRYAGDAARFYRNPEVVALDEHVDWFLRALDDPSRHLLMVESDGQGIGHVRLDQDEDDRLACRVGICVSPAERGKGRAAAILAAAMEVGRRSGLVRFVAEVHARNEPSARLFQRLGFSPDGQDGPFVRYTLTLAPPQQVDPRCT